MSDEEQVQLLRTRYLEVLGEHSPAFNMVEEDLDVEDVHDDLPDTAMVSGVFNASQPNSSSAQRTSRGDLYVRVRL